MKSSNSFVLWTVCGKNIGLSTSNGDRLDFAVNDTVKVEDKIGTLIAITDNKLLGIIFEDGTFEFNNPVDVFPTNDGPRFSFQRTVYPRYTIVEKNGFPIELKDGTRTKYRVGDSLALDTKYIAEHWESARGLDLSGCYCSIGEIVSINNRHDGKLLSVRIKHGGQGLYGLVDPLDLED